MKNQKAKLSLNVTVERPNSSNSFSDTSYAHVHLRLWATQLDGRTCHEDVINGLRWRDLAISCQTSSSNDAPWKPDHCYAWAVFFSQNRTDLRDAKEIVKTLSKLETGLQKLNSTLGYPGTFGQYIARVASVLGVSEIEFISEEKGEENMIRKPGDAVAMIDRLTVELWETCRKREGKPTGQESDNQPATQAA